MSAIALGKTKSRGALKDFWRFFRKTYPGADVIVSISRVGFNPERTQAIIQVGFTSGLVDGERDYVLLAKENGVRKILYLLPG